MIGLIPAAVLATTTIVIGFFQLDRISDQRANDLETIAVQRAEDLARDAKLEAYRDCVDLALIETRLRELFAYIHEKYPDSAVVAELRDGVDERFHARVEDCPLPPDN